MNDVTVPEPRLTKKQRAFLKEFLKSGNGTKAAMLTYDCDDIATAASLASQTLRLLKLPIRTYLEANGFSFFHLMTTLMGGLGAKRIYSSATEPDREIDDWPTRHRYLETAGRWLGIQTDPQFMQQINVQEKAPDLSSIVIIRDPDAAEAAEMREFNKKRLVVPTELVDKYDVRVTGEKKEFDEGSMSDDELDRLARQADSR